MNKLKSIKILGFRGQSRPLNISFDDKASFIVGRNGTGKTTLINLINAALSADFQGLRDARFDEIEIKFKSKRKVTTLRITKLVYEEVGTDFMYTIKDSFGEREFIINTTRRRPMQPRGTAPNLIVSRELRHALSEIYKTTWLSIQRTTEIERDEPDYPDQERVTDVDRKIEQVLNELVKYFSRLDSLVAEQTQVFQKRWFLSFLANERPPNITSIQKIDMGDERSSIAAIFEKFNVSKGTYESDLDRHFSLAQKAMDRLTEAGDKPTFKDFFVIYDVMRLHTLVEQWGALQELQRKIYMPKTEFVEIASDMFFRKHVQISRSNQVTVFSDDSHPRISSIPVKKLSSGEKQLLIFLSETLLQEQEPYIFLADEPELSLHIEWQEDLVPSLLRINPNAQVIFATHSPDVVNKYQSNLIMMEELID